MMHGVQGYFIERKRAAQRVALVAVSLAVAGLVPLVAVTLPPFRKTMRDLVHQTARFGYEGPDQFVRRIALQQLQGKSLVTRELGAIDTRHARRGGAVRARKVFDRHAPPEVRTDVEGPGTSEADLLQRAISRLANIPVVQSEDLVVVSASTPVYPEEQFRRDVEGRTTMQARVDTTGRVAVQVLIDTTGRVVDVQLLASTGVAPFERAVAEAVWQYRFRPYQIEGISREVYVVLRFRFTISYKT